MPPGFYLIEHLEVSNQNFRHIKRPSAFTKNSQNLAFNVIGEIKLLHQFGRELLGVCSWAKSFSHAFHYAAFSGTRQEHSSC